MSHIVRSERTSRLPACFTNIYQATFEICENLMHAKNMCFTVHSQLVHYSKVTAAMLVPKSKLGNGVAVLFTGHNLSCRLSN